MAPIKYVTLYTDR